MSDIQITHHPSKSDLEAMGVFTWPIWQKETSEFPWHYDETETCYFWLGRLPSHQMVVPLYPWGEEIWSGFLQA